MSAAPARGREVRLGLRENAAQFSLLVVINAFVGLMVGLERAVLPLIGRQNFHLTSDVALLTYLIAFGFSKAFADLAAGGLAARVGRRRILIIGWAAALPVPLLLHVAPSWAWVVGANVLLGINQGFAWSMTVVMKVDLVGPRRRGLALGLNEAAGYGGVALAAGLSGLVASHFAPRDVVVIGGAAFALIGFFLSAWFARDTADHVALEQRHQPAPDQAEPERSPALREAFANATYRVPALRSCAQAGLVNNLNDGLAWGLVPLFLAAHGASVAQVGLVAAVYPAVWAGAQVLTGAWSDAVGRKPLIVGGMLLQAAALGVLSVSGGRIAIALLSAVFLGLGTALVYPTLIAAMSDAVSPVERPPIVGVYRFWRDSGYAFGGLIAGAAAGALGYGGAIAIVGGLTAASGFWVLGDMPPRPRGGAATATSPGSSTSSPGVRAAAARSPARSPTGSGRRPDPPARRIPSG